MYTSDQQIDLINIYDKIIKNCFLKGELTMDEFKTQGIAIVFTSLLRHEQNKK